MDTRRLLFAALLSLVVLMGWQALFPPPPVVQDPGIQGEQTAPSESAQQTPSDSDGNSDGALGSDGADDPGLRTEGRERAATLAEAPAEPLEPIVGSGGQDVELATENWRATFSSTGARLISMRLLHRRGPDGEPVELVRKRSGDQPFPFSTVDAQGDPLDLDRAAFVVEEQAADQVRFRYRGPAGDATKAFTVGAKGLLEYDITVDAPRSWSLWFGPGVANPAWDEFEDRFSKSARQASVMGEELESVQASKVKETQVQPGAGVTWFSLEDKYFLVALAPRQQLAQIATVPVRTLGDEDAGIEGYVRAADDISAEGPEDVGLVATPLGENAAGSSYWGAKEYTRLRALPYDFEQTVRFGMFGVIARPLLYGLRWIHNNVTPNWGWSIVLMTLAINLVMFPLRHKSFISMQKMQKLNPRMESIRGKYRPKLKDKQGKPNLDMQRKMNEEIQGLFKEEGVNPAMGCLPLLVQMPVFFAFYRLLSQAVELQGAPWVGWIADLSVQDPYKALPLLMGATQFLQTKTMPPATNPTQRILMNTMPIWFTFFAFAFPAGLVLYWLTNNVLTIVQQAGYNQLKKMGYLGGKDATPAKPEKSKGKKKAKADGKG